MTLQRLVDQIEMMYLLIQLARDPLTRDVIFWPNYRMIERFGIIAYAEQIHTQALYVFAGEVRHNWGFGADIVKWAIDKFDEDERRTATPSIERDRAIAKGLVRYLMCALQKQRWSKALALMDADVKAAAEAKKKKGEILPIKKRILAEMKAATEYGLTRLIDHYWKPLQTGAKTQDQSRVEVSDYLKPVGDLASVPSTNYGWTELPPQGSPPSVTTKYYDIGRLGQMDLLFPHDDIQILGYDDNKNVKIIDRGTERTVTREGRGT